MNDIYAKLNAEKVEGMINKLTYKEGWSFSTLSYFSNTGWLFELRISIDVQDSKSLVSGKTIIPLSTNTWFPVPDDPMDDREAERWLLDCIMLVEQHEMCKLFRIDGEAIFYQNHGETGSSYRITRKA